jgi:Tfp pilus assembly protein PilO
MGLVWAVSLVIFVLVYFFALAPQIKTKAQLLSESAQKRQKYETSLNASKEETKKKLTDEVNVLKVKLNDFAVDFEESANLTFDISRIAADKQVNSFTVKTTEPVKDSTQLSSKILQENRIEIGFTSNFRQFATFLNALERHRPVVFVDRFKISRNDRDESANSVDMSLSVFVRKRPEG